MSNPSVENNINNYKRVTKEIYNLLESCRVSNGICNLVTLDPPGKYNVNNKTMEEIRNLYSKICGKVNLTIAEIPKEISYLKLDIDLDSKEKPVKRLYSKSQIMELVNLARESSKKFLNLNDSDMTAFVMEKKKYNDKDGLYRDGFHIAFPDIIQSSKIRNAIFDDLVCKLEKNNIFKNIKLPISKIVDRNASVGKTPWLILGCGKPECYPYKVTMILDSKNNKDKENLKNYKDNIKLLSLSNEMLSVDNCIKLKNNISMEKIEMNYQKISNDLNQMIPSTSQDSELSKILVRMLSVERASNYDDWIRVGYCLYNIDRTLLNEWIEFSKLCSSKFKKGECEKLWKKMKTGKDMLSIRSLHRWAKEDNYLEYSTFRNREYNNLFKQTMTGDHQSIANAIYAKYQTDFVCASIQHKTWYQYNYGCHRWERVENGYSLTQKITDEFVNEYINMSTELYHKAAQAEQPQKSEYLNEVSKIQALINRLNNEAFLSSLMTALARRFYIRKFADELDENYDLIGFNNGVYDLRKKKFRDGQPEDFITMTTGLDYQPLDTSSEEYQEVLELFEDIHPDKDTREYVYTLLSTFVAGHHKEETLHLFNGCGSNGKSVTFDLLKHVFGDYFMSVPITLLTRKRGGSENASPMLAQLKGKRLGVLQEPEEGEKLHVGLMKELTGNDEITARPLFEQPVTFKPQIKFAIPCNNLPEVPARDKGTWRRLRVINHLMEFVDKPDPKNKNHKKRNNNLKEKLEGYAGQFMSFLIDRYLNIYCKEGLKVPESVKYATNMYNQDNNCLKQFCDSKLEITGKKQDRISVITLWNEFKNYHKEEHDGSKRPLKREFESYCNNVFGNSVAGKGGKSYCGIVFSGDDEEDENIDL